MIKRANGKIANFTDEDGNEVETKSDVVWADEKEKPVIKDALNVDSVTDINLDVEATDIGDDVVAKDC